MATAAVPLGSLIFDHFEFTYPFQNPFNRIKIIFLFIKFRSIIFISSHYIKVTGCLCVCKEESL